MDGGATHPAPLEYLEDGLLVSSDPARVDFDAVHGFLESCYWSPGVHPGTLRRAMEHSLVFGVYGPGGEQRAFARVVTDRTTFAWVCDVFVLEPYRGGGLSHVLLRAMERHPDLQGLRTWLLATRDAHGLYTKHGFVPLPNPDWWMRRPAAPDHEGGRRVALERERNGKPVAPAAGA
ncbi:MAG TPA: GNAT family N-acetyltransferase [Longimicrobiaceae bacterium]|nr:GNAT family N-acetyltransferase [Longimicrobiaceae bacterium]